MIVKRLGVLTLALLAAACDRNEEQPVDAGISPARPASAPQLTAADAERMLRDKAAAGLRAILPDPDDARYTDLRAGTAGAVCGRIDTEQPDGKRSGPRPFVVTPDGVAVISLTPTLMLNDPEDLFPDYYIRWCATPAELATLEVTSELNMAAPDIEMPPELAELADPPGPSEPLAPRETTAAAPESPAPAPSSNLESFSKAVIRGERPKE